jgi:hypothetical protein
MKFLLLNNNYVIKRTYNKIPIIELKEENNKNNSQKHK